jgi:hypothetical protein
MAFKLKHTGNSAFLFHGDPTEHPQGDVKSKPVFSEDDYTEVGRNVTTRRGEQDGVMGTFTDTNITERADFNTEIPSAIGGEQTKNVPEYIEGLKKRFPGVPGSVLIEQGFIGPEFGDQFDLDYSQRDRLESSFTPDAVPEKINYAGFVSGMGTASDFGARGYSQNYDNTADQRRSKNIIKRMQANEAAGVMPVKKIYGQYNQGGSAGLVDTDTRNRQAEQGQVLGIINKEDFDLGQNFGMGYINQNLKDARAAARERFSEHKDPAILEQEKKAALALANEQRALAKSGKFATPEMEKRYKGSHDVIFSRMLNAPKTGGGRTGKTVTSATTNVDTGYFDN